MISNNSNNFSVDGGLPRKNGGYTSHHALRSISGYISCATFFRGIPPSTEESLQLFFKKRGEESRPSPMTKSPIPPENESQKIIQRRYQNLQLHNNC